MLKIVYKNCKSRENESLPVFCSEEDKVLARYILQCINVSKEVKNQDGNLIFGAEDIWKEVYTVEALELPKKVAKELETMTVPGICYYTRVPTMYIIKSGKVYVYDPDRIQDRYASVQIIVDWVGKDLSEKNKKG